MSIRDSLTDPLDPDLNIFYNDLETNTFLYSRERLQHAQSSLLAIRNGEPLFTVLDHERNVLTKRTEMEISYVLHNNSEITSN